jgi:murein L,D-transpeptidase YafK
MTMKKKSLVFIALSTGSMLFLLPRQSDPHLQFLNDEHVLRELVAPLPAPPDLPAGTADEVLINKGAHKLILFRYGRPMKTYRIALGRNPVGKKTREGDLKTPEGCYVIDGRNPDSRFYRSLHISYPNAEDEKEAAALGVSPGGDIMIHGLKNGKGWIGKRHRRQDWTNGCVAVTNSEMDEIWSAVPDGTPVTIVP